MEHKLRALIYLIAGIVVLLPTMLSVFSLYTFPPEASTYVMIWIVCFVIFFLIFIRKVWRGEA